MTDVQIIRIVVASPGDVASEREIVEEVVDELNRGVATAYGVRLEVARWETDAYPGFHPQGPQGLVDTVLRIENCDLLLGIFWKRFGTPVADAQSGTEHEFRLAYETWKKKGRPQIMVYFNQRSYTPKSKQETDQWGQVLEFKAEFPKEGLWWSYNGKNQFERLVREHLTRFLLNRSPPVHEAKSVLGGQQQTKQGSISSFPPSITSIPQVAERLYSNLLPVETFPHSLFIAVTEHRRLSSLWAEIRRFNPTATGACVLRSGLIIAAHDLREYPWSRVCDTGTVEEFDSIEWAESADLDRRRIFVELLLSRLRNMLYPAGIRFDFQDEAFYFMADPDGVERREAYMSLHRPSSREVVKRYIGDSEPGNVRHYRHSGFKGAFRRFDGQWYLEITPTYLFTFDGFRRLRYHEELLKGIKRIEGNAAVLGQVAMWANILHRISKGEETDAQPLLTFGELLVFDVIGAVDDAAWSRPSTEGSSTKKASIKRRTRGR
jgi:hypothetical protein